MHTLQNPCGCNGLTTTISDIDKMKVFNNDGNPRVGGVLNRVTIRCCQLADT